MKLFLLVACWFLFEQAANSQDSIFILIHADTIHIAMAKKMVVFDEFDHFKTFSKGEKTFLLVKGNIDTIKCYVFKSNLLVGTGNLLIKNKSNKKVAVRSGFWYTVKNGEIKSKVRYLDDEKNIIKWNLKSKKHRMDYNGKGSL